MKMFWNIIPWHLPQSLVRLQVSSKIQARFNQVKILCALENGVLFKKKKTSIFQKNAMSTSIYLIPSTSQEACQGP